MNKQPRVLYVDDEEDLLTLALTFFEDEAMPLDTCSTISEAIEKVRKNSYDIIISDAIMPSGSGKELFGMLKTEKVFSGKFILVTGNLEIKSGEGDEHYDLVLYKPIRFQDLVAEVRKMYSINL
jgi:DNA-binding response OmpR family regulator